MFWLFWSAVFVWEEVVLAFQVGVGVEVGGWCLLLQVLYQIEFYLEQLLVYWGDSS